MTWLRQFLCRLRGHADTLQVERTRVYLQCAICGAESTGWTWLPSAPPSTSTRILRFKKRLAA